MIVCYYYFFIILFDNACVLDSLTHFVLDRFLTKVMASTTTTPSTGSTAAQENLKRKSNDPGWEYAMCVNLRNWSK